MLNNVNISVLRFSGNQQLIKQNEIDITNNDRLPEQTDKSFKSIYDLSPDKLIAIQMTRFMPKNQTIMTTRNANMEKNGVGPTRNTVHFSLNRPVPAYDYGSNWVDYPIAIMAPFNEILKEHPKKDIIGGKIDDFVLKGNVKLPEGTIIIRKNDKIPEGKLKVVNTEEIEELKNTKGVQVFETSENVHKTANTLVKKLGYTNTNTFLKENWGIYHNYEDGSEGIQTPKHDLIEQMDKSLNGWKAFLKKNDLKYCNFPVSPYTKAEALMNIIVFLAGSNKWKHENVDIMGVEKMESVDFQKVIPEQINSLQNTLGEGEEFTYDVNSLSEIVKQSETPKDALKEIKDKLKISLCDDVDALPEIPPVMAISQAMMHGIIDEKGNSTPFEPMEDDFISA